MKLVSRDGQKVKGKKGLKDVSGSFDFFECGWTSRQGKAKRGKSEPGQSSLSLMRSFVRRGRDK